jgi:hypothetical protein
MGRLQIGVAALVIALGLPLAAHAQSTFSPDRVGWEFGQSVATGRGSGELAMYVGATQGNNLIAFRAGILDETDTVPCSIGVMYQYIVHGNASSRIKPTAGVSVGRVFSCASDSDPRKGSPSINGTANLSGGVRIAVFSGKSLAGSLDVMAYVERLNRVTLRTDRTMRGVMVGVAIHSPGR